MGLTGKATATQENDQLAIQLGAIQLGYTTNRAWTTNSQLIANALTQGNQALLARTTAEYKQYVGTTNISTNYAPVAQSSSFRDQLYQATLSALSAPVTYTNRFNPPINVVVYTSSTKRTSTNKVTALSLNPTLTTPSKIAGLATARIPNQSLGLISNAVAASVFIGSTNTYGVVFPLFGTQPAAATVKKATNDQSVYNLNVKTAAAQIANAGTVANAAMTAALKAYATGTTQWVAVNKTTGPASNSVYLPNYTTKAIGPTLNAQNPALLSLANAAAAVAANAINGLGSINTNTTASTANLYGKTAGNVQAIARQLTLAAAKYQATSVSKVTTPANSPYYSSGALGANALGMISQVSSLTPGVANDTWGSSSGGTGLTSILVGIVKGAVSAVGKTSANLAPIATGIAQGFYATYLRTFQDTNPGQTPKNAADFAAHNINSTQIVNAFTAAGVSGATLTKYSITSGNVEVAFNNVYQAYVNGNTNQFGAWNFTDDKIAGAKGINLTTTNSQTLPPLLNGVGTPVTDTVGL
jgi:hypothetical protein